MRYDMQDCKRSDTLMAKKDIFSLNQCLKNNFEEKEIEIKKIPYVSAVGSLMYAQICTRSDIVYATRMLADIK